MQASHRIQQTDTGIVHIYLTPRSPRPGERQGLLRSILHDRSQSRQIVRAAKSAGLSSAVALRNRRGFGILCDVEQFGGALIGGPRTMCIELVATRSQLQAFCQDYKALIGDAVVTFNQLEQWRVLPGLALVPKGPQQHAQ